MKKFRYVVFFHCLIYCSCGTLKIAEKQDLDRSFYIKDTGKERNRVYIDVIGDSIRTYPTTTFDNSIVVDTLIPFKSYPPEIPAKANFNFTAIKHSFDIDFITIPLKLRFSEKNIPPQFNSNVNGAIYLGFRTDKYNIYYKINPLQMNERNLKHLGYSIGLFTGFGNTFISPTNTNYVTQHEYDGIVWSNGIAGIIGVNSLTIGLAFGFDKLLDENNTNWLYENKPWIGLGIGLNLN